MQCLITSHWPHPDINPDPVPWFIYLKAETPLGQSVRPGDRVLFYRTADFRIDGKPVKSVQQVSGPQSETVALRTGPGGIVGAASVVRTIEAVPTGQPRFIYDPERDFGYQIRCTEPLARSRRIVPYAEMLSILGESPKKPAFAFGLYRIKDASACRSLMDAAGLP
jgi:hypothetical protein